MCDTKCRKRWNEKLVKIKWKRKWDVKLYLYLIVELLLKYVLHFFPWNKDFGDMEKTCSVFPAQIELLHLHVLARREKKTLVSCSASVSS